MDKLAQLAAALRDKAATYKTIDRSVSNAYADAARMAEKLAGPTRSTPEPAEGSKPPQAPLGGLTAKPRLELTLDD